MGEYKQRLDNLADKIQDVADELDKQKGILNGYVSELRNLRDAIERLEEKRS